MQRLRRILDEADALGMVAIVGYFYFGQDERLEDEQSVIRATENATDWLLAQGYTNVLVEVGNEVDNRAYDHTILCADRCHELISLVQARSEGRVPSTHGRLLVSTSLCGNVVPPENLVAVSDYLLLHGNGVRDPDRIRAMVDQTRQRANYRGQPILFNEDDHFDFGAEDNNMLAALDRYAGWGYFDYRMAGESHAEGTRASRSTGNPVGAQARVLFVARQGDGCWGRRSLMDTRLLGRTGLPVSRLGVGLAEIGGLDLAEARQAAEVLNLALDSGVTFFDTSACYDNSEALIGKTMGHRRAEFVLATKAGHVVGGYQGEEWTAQTVLDSIDRSLMRLRTDYLDLVQLHSCDVEVLKKGEVILALQEAQRAGKTRFIGYSGDNEGALWAVKSGLFDTLQTSYNLVDQGARRDLFEIAEAGDMGIIVKRPIANGAWGAATSPSLYADGYFRRAEMMRGLGQLHAHIGSDRVGAEFRAGSRGSRHCDSGDAVLRI